ncbi:hypothetical protein Plo01_16600 [Planobispora longispora]|uniref:Uncharacterized protein n=1 Tax=Planobispora longispora TaxID=28887 RepID=A0A8J3RJD2_9ACTN|nr:hypothetical protein Plo01_16600 [Planobispora longispora]
MGESSGPFSGRTGFVPDRALPYTCETALGTVSSRVGRPGVGTSGGSFAAGPPCPGTGCAGRPAARGGTGAAAGDRNARVRSSSSCQSPTSHLRHFLKHFPTNGEIVTIDATSWLAPAQTRPQGFPA